MNEKDLRVKKTRKNIEQSFIDLLHEQSFQKITVQDILDKAMINRTTFYRHYTDKYELADILSKAVYKWFESYIEQRFSYDLDENMVYMVQQLYKKFYEERKQILALFSIHEEQLNLYEDMYQCLKNNFLIYYSEKLDEESENMDYFATVYASFVMTSAKWVMEHNYNADTSQYFERFYNSLKLLLNRK